MGTYLPEGACKEEIQAALDAKKALDKAYLDFLGAQANVEAGMWGSGAGVLVIMGCVGASVTGIGAVICFGAGGATAVSGALWTASSVPGLKSTRDALEDAIENAEKAIDSACKCINSHAVCVPD